LFFFRPFLTARFFRQPTVILIGDKAKHLQVCPLATVTCEICQKTHLRQDSETHITQKVFSHFTALAEELKQSKAELASFKQEAQSKISSLEREAKQALRKSVCPLSPVHFRFYHNFVRRPLRQVPYYAWWNLPVGEGYNTTRQSCGGVKVGLDVLDLSFYYVRLHFEPPCQLKYSAYLADPATGKVSWFSCDRPSVC
jgi:hypothetical protein